MKMKILFIIMFYSYEDMIKYKGVLKNDEHVKSICLAFGGLVIKKDLSFIIHLLILFLKES